MTNVLKYRGYEGTAEVDVDRGVCRGKILFIDDVVTYEAGTPGELKTEFEAAIDDYLATCQELGRAPKKPFSGQFNVRVPPQLHRAAAIKATETGVSLNSVIVEALSSYLHAGSLPQAEPPLRRTYAAATTFIVQTRAGTPASRVRRRAPAVLPSVEASLLASFEPTRTEH